MPTRPPTPVRIASAIVLVLALAGLTAPPAAAQAGPGGRDTPSTAGDKLHFEACPAFSEDYTFDCYHDYGEITSFLRAAAEAYPELTTLSSLGTSWEGREIWLVTITDPDGGEAGTKPAVWVDGGIDADEVVSVEAALGLVHRLLTSDEARVRELVRTRTFHVAPVLMPDANQLHHATPIRPRDTSLRPWDDDGDGRADEDPPEDLDGDGQALTMVKRDPLGGWVREEEEPRLFRERRPGDEGPFFARYLEGVDNDGDGEYQEDRLGGVDPNRNYPGNWNIRHDGSGPFPASEAGVRAAFDFLVEHPEVAASQHFHSSGGVVLFPPSVPELELPPADRELYLDLARHGLEITGYDLATSVYDWNWPPGSGNRKSGQVWRGSEGRLRGWPPGESGYPAYGGSIDAMYTVFGVLAFANEMYAMGRDYDGDGTIDEAEQLRYSDEELDGYAFREYRPFEHPQLGRVEIGGWRKFGHNNPPPSRLPEEVAGNVEFVLMQAAHTPLLEVGDVEVEDLGDGVYRVTAEARNAGYQPTELALRRQQGRAEPVRATLRDVEVLDAEAERDLGVLQGHDRKETSWIVRGRPGDRLTVRLRHPKGGTATAEATLPGGV